MYLCVCKRKKTYLSWNSPWSWVQHKYCNRFGSVPSLLASFPSWIQQQYNRRSLVLQLEKQMKYNIMYRSPILGIMMWECLNTARSTCKSMVAFSIWRNSQVYFETLYWQSRCSLLRMMGSTHLHRTQKRRVAMANYSSFISPFIAISDHCNDQIK